MKRPGSEPREGERQITIADFLLSYNQNMPANFPRVSVELLEQFKSAHAGLFTHGDLWSLERHRKRLMDWLPRQREASDRWARPKNLR